MDGRSTEVSSTGEVDLGQQEDRLASEPAGPEFLRKKSETIKSSHDAVLPMSILAVDDNQHDANHLAATLRIILGYSANIRTVATIGTVRDAIAAQMPECLFLDDRLQLNVDAGMSIPFIRRCGYSGPIIIVSGFLTRERRQQLSKMGVVDALDKDDIDSVRLRQALQRVAR